MADPPVLLKYPRTSHLAGSRVQSGDEDLELVPFSAIKGRRIVVEEKLDGANSGLRFDGAGTAYAQSRGHYLDLAARGGRERHWNRFKDWLRHHQDAFLQRFEDRYGVYGEWCFAAHTVYYDRLPHWWHEFDVYDHAAEKFLDTAGRARLLAGLPIVSVPVLYAGPARSLDHLLGLIRPALYKSEGWREAMLAGMAAQGLDPARNVGHFEDSDLSEGLYIKVEEDGFVTRRLKLVRPGFTQTLLANDTHWLSRPILENGLVAGADIFADGLSWLPGNHPAVRR